MTAGPKQRAKRASEEHLPEPCRLIVPTVRTIRQTSEDCPKRAASVERILQNRGMSKHHPGPADAA